MKNKKFIYSISLLVVLDDWIDISNIDTIYINEVHRTLIEISVLLYHMNLHLSLLNMNYNYKIIYHKYGKSYFDLILKLAADIDNKTDGGDIEKLILQYEKLTNCDCTELYEVNLWK